MAVLILILENSALVSSFIIRPVVVLMVLLAEIVSMSLRIIFFMYSFMKTLAYPVCFNATEWHILAKIAERYAIYRAEQLHMSVQSQTALCKLSSMCNSGAVDATRLQKPVVLWLSPYESWLLLRGERVILDNCWFNSRDVLIPWCIRGMIWPIAQSYKFFNINKL